MSAQRSPLSEGDTVQNPQRMPEPVGSTLGISRTCLPVLVSLIKQARYEINDNDNKTEHLQHYVTSYMNVLSLPLMAQLVTGRAME